MNDALLNVQNINLNINGKAILENINFQVLPHQIVTIIGPNGSGKTSLVKVVVGLIKPTSGNILWQYKPNIGYVPQKFNVNENMPLKVREFIKLSMDIRNYGKKHYDRIISVIDISNLLNTEIIGLSGGEMQRVMLFNALIASPDILILDEPMQGVDIKGQDLFYSTLHEIKEEFNLSVLLVSHDIHFVMKKTDLVICMNKHICCLGRPEEVSVNEKYYNLFGKEVSQLLSPYRHEHNHNHIHY